MKIDKLIKKINKLSKDYNFDIKELDDILSKDTITLYPKQFTNKIIVISFYKNNKDLII